LGKRRSRSPPPAVHLPSMRGILGERPEKRREVMSPVQPREYRSSGVIERGPRTSHERTTSRDDGE